MKKEVKHYLETVAQGEDQKTKDEFLNLVMKHLFCTITDHEVWEKIEPEVKKVFVAEAKMIVSTRLWPWMVAEMKTIAEKKMFDEALSFDDMRGGKFMLYTLAVIDKKLNKLSKL